MKISLQGMVISVAIGVISFFVMGSKEAIFVAPAVTAVVWALFSKFEKSSKEG